MALHESLLMILRELYGMPGNQTQGGCVQGKFPIYGTIILATILTILSSAYKVKHGVPFLGSFLHVPWEIPSHSCFHLLREFGVTSAPPGEAVPGLCLSTPSAGRLFPMASSGFTLACALVPVESCALRRGKGSALLCNSVVESQHPTKLGVPTKDLPHCAAR